jgi:hypothetical protein
LLGRDRHKTETGQGGVKIGVWGRFLLYLQALKIAGLGQLLCGRSRQARTLQRLLEVQHVLCGQLRPALFSPRLQQLRQRFRTALPCPSLRSVPLGPWRPVPCCQRGQCPRTSFQCLCCLLPRVPNGIARGAGKQHCAVSPTSHRDPQCRGSSSLTTATQKVKYRNTNGQPPPKLSSGSSGSLILLRASMLGVSGGEGILSAKKIDFKQNRGAEKSRRLKKSALKHVNGSTIRKNLPGGDDHGNGRNRAVSFHAGLKNMPLLVPLFFWWWFPNRFRIFNHLGDE